MKTGKLEFDITDASVAEKIWTRDGRSVRILCTNRKGKKPIVGLVLQLNGDEIICAFNEDGTYCCANCIDALDLTTKNPYGDMYVNIFYDPVTMTLCPGRSMFETPEEAMSSAKINSGFGAVHIEVVRVPFNEKYTNSSTDDRKEYILKFRK